MKITDILTNPARARVIQYLQIHKEATTKQISEAIPDIPAPTLYRHINFLLKENLLIIKEERKVRGSLERLLAINTDMWSAETGSNLSDMAYQFLMSLYMRFQEYSTMGNTDPIVDKLCLRTCILSLTDNSFDSFLREYAELIGRYQEPEDGGKLRSVSFISAPVSEEEKV